MDEREHRIAARMRMIVSLSALLSFVMMPAFYVMAETDAVTAAEAEGGQAGRTSDTQEDEKTDEESVISRLQEGCRELLLNFDYGEDTVYVIGHTSPDADTVCSAIGMANLLSELGVKAEPAIAGSPNPQTEFILKEAGLECPELLEDASGKQLYLVDHSSLTQTVSGGENARIVGMLDHHGLSGISTKEMINAVSVPIGSTCTLVYYCYEHCGVELSPTIAGILASGIISDCCDRQMILDSIALEDLSAIAGITDPEGYAGEVISAKSDFDGMSDEEIYLLDYKQYESGGLTFGIGCVEIPSSEDIPDMYERMIWPWRKSMTSWGWTCCS